MIVDHDEWSFGWGWEIKNMNPIQNLQVDVFSVGEWEEYLSVIMMM